MLLDRGDFDSDETFESFMKMLYQSRPEILEKTPVFGEVEFFPPSDPISQFATKWKEANPDPTLGSVQKHKAPILARKGGG